MKVTDETFSAKENKKKYGSSSDIRWKHDQNLENGKIQATITITYKLWVSFNRLLKIYNLQFFGAFFKKY